MAVSYVAEVHNEAAGGGTSLAGTGTLNVTAGDTLVAFGAHEDSAATISIADNKGGSWEKVTSRLWQVSTSTGPIGQMWVCRNHPGDAAVTVTATWSASSDFRSIQCAQFRGAQNIDVRMDGIGSGTAIATNARENTTTDAVLYTAMKGYTTLDLSSWMGGSGTEISDLSAAGSGYQILSSTAARTGSATASASAAWVAAAVVLSAAASAKPVQYIDRGASANGTTSISVPYPEVLAANDLLVLTVVSKHANAPSTPSGWTLEKQTSGGSGSSGADSGNVYTSVYTKVAAGSETGTLSVTKTTETGTGMLGRMYAFRRAGTSWSTAAESGTDTTTGNAWSVTATADPGVAADDVVLAVSGDNTDAGAAWTSLALSSTSITYGTVTDQQNSGTTQGNDMRLVVAETTAASGTSSAAPVFTATAASAPTNGHCGVTVFLRVRSAGTTHNITADFSGSGSLSADATVPPHTHNITADFSGTGSLTAIVNPPIPTLVQGVKYGSLFDGQGISEDQFKFRLPNLIGLGNYCVVFLLYGNNGGSARTISSVTSGGESYTSAVSVTSANGSPAIKLAAYVLEGAGSGAAAVNEFVVTFSGNLNSLAVSYVEFCNVNGVGVTASAADDAAPSVATGSFSPTAGSLLLHYAANTDNYLGQSGQVQVTSWTPGTDWTLEQADYASGKSGNPPVCQVAMALQRRIAPGGSVTPTITTSGTAAFSSVALELTAGTGGVLPPSTIHIRRAAWWTHTNLDAADWSQPFPCDGDCIALQDGQGAIASTPSDSASNAWSLEVAGDQNAVVSLSVATDPTTGDDLVITMPISGSGSRNTTAVIYDIHGADLVSPTAQFVTTGPDAVTQTITHQPDITPLYDNGVIIVLAPIGIGPLTSLDAPTGALNTAVFYGAETDFDTFNNSDGSGVFYYGTDKSAQNWSWTKINGTTQNIYTTTVEIKASGAATHSIVPDFSGAGSLDATTPITRPIVPSFAGTGDVAATATVSHPVTVALDGGAGALDVAVSVNHALAVDLSGAGDLVADTPVSRPITVDLSGAGSLDITAAVDHAVLAAFSGLGQLDASVAINGGGTLHSITIALSGDGAFTADVLRNAAISAAMDGSGSLSADVSRTAGITLTLTGSGSLDADVAYIAGLLVAMAGVGDLTATVTAFAEGTPLVPGGPVTFARGDGTTSARGTGTTLAREI